ncbi:MAG: IS6 family transposase [Cyanobacteria bacterium]|nr:IS6 family transposase [Cyanobacteria bacterium CG_2015-16_32_12]NCO78431.1 IS6 family transposase [Cyanobacteria bacterium CG_2015-22_32_23]NCQ04818.1 IS6 family transposase [Cyanobacteria bacterium CG_2015-09_32_10]NCQ42056.1 IS6 family transposase [Cyanobacteria bacterium CG_2015-04_32_10]NCS84246.1 IS6 family transposase [Cyanobacteria bacterium CG_2015-02_32_10]
MRNASHDHWEQIKDEIILLCIQWYVTERLSYSQLKIIMQQRGFKIDPRTINFLVQEYSAKALKRFRETERKSRKGWRIVQIPFKLQGRKKYLYRALDAQGNTLDFIITGGRNKEKAKFFFETTISKNPEITASKILSRRQKIRVQNNNFFTGLVSIILLSVIGMLVFNQLAKHAEKNNQTPKFNNNTSYLHINYYSFT